MRSKQRIEGTGRVRRRQETIEILAAARCLSRSELIRGGEQLNHSRRIAQITRLFVVFARTRHKELGYRGLNSGHDCSISYKTVASMSTY